MIACNVKIGDLTVHWDLMVMVVLLSHGVGVNLLVITGSLILALTATGDNSETALKDMNKEKSTIKCNVITGEPIVLATAQVVTDHDTNRKYI